MKLKLNLLILNKNQRLGIEIVEAVFRVTSVSFIVVFAVEYFVPGFATNWFNPVWLLITAFITGTIMIFKK